MVKRSFSLILASLMLLTAILFPARAAAAAAATVLSLPSVTATVGVAAELTATLKRSDGTPLPDQPVEFYINGEYYDYVSTDDAGVAVYHYVPYESPGTHTMEARFPGSDELKPSSAKGVMTLFGAPAVQDLEVTGTEDAPLSIELEIGTGGSANLTPKVVTAPLHGTLGKPTLKPCKPADQTCTVTMTYTPAADFAGSDSFTYIVANGGGESGEATVWITIENRNDAPTVLTREVVMVEQSAGAGLRLVVTDPDHEEVTFNVTASNGSLTNETPYCEADEVTGQWLCTYSATYVPNSYTNSEGTITFTATDSTTTTDPVTVTVKWNSDGSVYVDGAGGGNQPPTAESLVDAKAVTVTGSGQLITLSAQDPNGDALTFKLLSRPAIGQLGEFGPAVCNESTCTVTVPYTYPAGTSGNTLFDFQVTDKAGATSEPAQVRLQVNTTPVAEGLTATSATYNMNEDGQIELTFTGSNSAEKPLTFQIDTPKKGGALSSVSQPACDPATGICTVKATYTPYANYYGTERISFAVSDGAKTSAPGWVSVVIAPVNDPPVAARIGPDLGMIVTVPSSVITLSAWDPDGDPLTFKLTAQTKGLKLGQLGKTVCEGGTCTATLPFTYEPGFRGTPGVAFEVTDEFGAKDWGDLSVQIGSNYAPTAERTDYELPVGGAPLTVTFTATDRNKDPLTFEIGKPSKGSLSAPSAPACDPATGTCKVAATYTPPAGYTGADLIFFKVHDGYGYGGYSNPVPVVIHVGGRTTVGVNTVPIVRNTRAQTDEDKPLEITLTGLDMDSDQLSFHANQPMRGGTLSTPSEPSCEPGSCTVKLTYTPRPNYHGVDYFSYTVSDGKNGSNVALVEIKIAPVNDAPLPDWDAQIAAKMPHVLLANAWDADGDNLTFRVHSLSAGAMQGPQGQVGCSANSCWVNLPIAFDPSFHGVIELGYGAEDQAGGSNVARNTIRVGSQGPSGSNSAPVATGGSFRVNEGDLTIRLTFVASDQDKQPLTFSLGQASGGTLGTVWTEPCDAQTGVCKAYATYTPKPGFVGIDRVRFTATDGSATSDASIMISVKAGEVPATPTAVRAEVTRNKKTMITVDATDPNPSSMMIFKRGTAPTKGSLGSIDFWSYDQQETGGKANMATVYYAYDPVDGFIGEDSFGYRATNTAGSSAETFVQVKVLPPQENPMITDRTYNTVQGEPIWITLSASDITDTDLTFAIETGPYGGTVSELSPVTCTYSEDRVYTCTAVALYIPDPNFSGTETIRYRAKDKTHTSEAGEIAISVQYP